MEMTVLFSQIAKFLSPPLIVAGLALVLVFSVHIQLIKSGIIPPVKPTTGGRLLQLLLKYGFILGLVASIFGGIVCVLISKDREAALWLAGMVLVLGFALAIPALSETNGGLKKAREGAVDNMEAMENAKQPPFTRILNPIIGAVGVIAGSRLKKTGRNLS